MSFLLRGEHLKINRTKKEIHYLNTPSGDSFVCDQEHQRAKGKKRKNKREDRIIQDKIEEEEKKETFPIKASAKQTASL